MPAKSLSRIVDEQQNPNIEESVSIDMDKFQLNIEEIKFILAKLAQIEFKGVEIEFTYNLIMKLQEHFKYLSIKK